MPGEDKQYYQSYYQLTINNQFKDITLLFYTLVSRQIQLQLRSNIFTIFTVNFYDVTIKNLITRTDERI